jgi:hypothetical protein
LNLKFIRQTRFRYLSSKKAFVSPLKLLLGDNNMKKSILFVLFSILAFSFAVQAQDDGNRYSSSRLTNLTNQLKRQTVDLADRTSEDLRRNNSSTRADIDAAFLAQQLDASAGLFQQMVSDGNRAAALRDAAAILSDLSRRAPGGYLWRDAQKTIGDINRELGSGGGNNDGGGDNTNNGEVVGRVFWRGKVDSKVQLIIQGKSLRVNTFAGQNYGEGTFSFTSPLPTRNISVSAVKTAGRGNVRMVQQPSRSNDYTAIIEITDDENGARDYQLEIVWK